MRRFIGIDPGKNGGIVILGGGDLIEVNKMPPTERDVWNILRPYQHSTDTFCLIEKVHSMPGQGVSSSFTFGMGYGALRMALVASEIPFEAITPQAWQKGLGCLTGGDKNVSKERAQNLFPKIKVTHAIADALLIAEWCRRKNQQP